jgi:hypothetical protein
MPRRLASSNVRTRWRHTRHKSARPLGPLEADVCYSSSTAGLSGRADPAECFAALALASASTILSSVGNRRGTAFFSGTY